MLLGIHPFTQRNDYMYTQQIHMYFRKDLPITAKPSKQSKYP